MLKKPSNLQKAAYRSVDLIANTQYQAFIPELPGCSFVKSTLYMDPEKVEDRPDEALHTPTYFVTTTTEHSEIVNFPQHYRNLLHRNQSLDDWPHGGREKWSSFQRFDREKELQRLKILEDNSSYWPQANLLSHEQWKQSSKLKRFVMTNVHLYWDETFRRWWRGRTIFRRDISIHITEKWRQVEEGIERQTCRRIINQDTQRVKAPHIWNQRPMIWKVLYNILPWSLLVLELAYIPGVPSMLTEQEKEVEICHYIDNLANSIYQTISACHLNFYLLSPRNLMFEAEYDKFASESYAQGLRTRRAVVPFSTEHQARIKALWLDPETYCATRVDSSNEKRAVSVMKSEFAYFRNNQVNKVAAALEQMFSLGETMRKDDHLVNYLLGKWLEDTLAEPSFRRKSKTLTWGRCWREEWQC